jgi:hypothetical protein
MKRGDEAFNGSLLQFLRSVNRFIASSLQYFFIIMYFSLPEDIPPRPLGGTRVRKHCSPVICTVITGFRVLYETVSYVLFMYALL